MALMIDGDSIFQPVQLSKNVASAMFSFNNVSITPRYPYSLFPTKKYVMKCL